MRLMLNSGLRLAGLLVLLASLSYGTTPAKKPSSNSKTAKSQHSGRKSRHTRGQQAIDGTRATQIQEALIREHYLSGEPSGKWDDATQQALRRYQGDQGWQNKSVPDSRALIRLGLGPDHQHLLNPESAMTTEAPLAHRNEKPLSTTPPQHVAGASASSLPAGSAAGSPASNPPDLSPSR